MATMLLSRPSPFLSKTCLSQTSSSQISSSTAWGTLAMTTQDINALTSLQSSKPAMSISQWSPLQQARLLANLALISQGNKGWIFVANAPAPLSRQALIKAGINPARVIDAKRASETLVEQARNSPSIAAVVCWKGSQMISNTLNFYQQDQCH